MRRNIIMTFLAATALLLGASPVAASGTPTIVKDINPSGSSNPGPVMALGNIVLFAADDGVHGRELWRSDGTNAGTYMVSNIRAGSAGSDPMLMAVAGGYLYFQACDGSHGRELWRTDGSSAGATLVKDLNPGA